MKWIETSDDNLPDHDQMCFAYCGVEKSGYVTIITFDETQTDYWLEYYTHWMPVEFPKPPQT